jgi:hypothetical protein
MIERGKGALLFEEVHTRILGRNEGGRTTGMVPSRKTDLMQGTEAEDAFPPGKSR